MIALLLAAALSSTRPGTPAASAPPMDLQAYSAELQHVEHEIDGLKTTPQSAEQLRQSLPEHWTVAHPGADVIVDSRFLRDALADFQKAPPARKPAMLDELHRRLEAMREESTGFSGPSAANRDARNRLDRILAAHEFSSVHPPSLAETWKDRILATLDRWLSRASEKLPDVPGLGRIFVWIAIAIVTSALAVWLYRFASQKVPEIKREVVPFAPSSKNWRLWLAEADAEAAAGHWRDAVHLVYWAGVSYLESSGLWRPDRARTPREYVKAIASGNPVQPLFSSFTRRFEGIWYGGRSAALTDFQQARAELEQLGCR